MCHWRVPLTGYLTCAHRSCLTGSQHYSLFDNISHLTFTIVVVAITEAEIMADNSGQSSLPIAPPLLIGLCILGAVITVIVTAALYKLCRRATVEVGQEAGEKTWKPNQRSVEQSRYMEEVRLRNKMFAWERARAGRSESHEQDRDDKRYKVSH